MPEASNTDSSLYSLIIIVVLVLLIPPLIMFFNKFTNELRYINCEIERTDGAERQYWRKKKQRLWLSLIPFVKH